MRPPVRVTMLSNSGFSLAGTKLLQVSQAMPHVPCLQRSLATVTLPYP